ncbi:unnamed protein product [Adineta steineri]|uniref:G-protein coupled receptors family 1 profile domain-containing protein n=1 Tax=Adineta steineri TaxID=433720 RepID=A0A813WQ71_9BILA|nr:unnamed protein product [Adineta steineri]CAF4069882.1 unnamed protein product [Adineta steineri]
MSSSSTITPAIVQLQFISQYISMTLGFILLISGTIGNSINTIVFFKLGNWKHNACSLYIFVKSLFDLFLLIIGVTNQITRLGFNIDLTAQSRVWCKLAISLINITFLNSLTCMCLQSIDAYFCSSRSPTWRQKSNVRMARYYIVGFLFLWICHVMPYGILYNLLTKGSTSICTTINPNFVRYNTYFVNLCLYAVIPIIIVTVFSFLTYRNLRTLTTQDRHSLSTLTRQMISLALLQVITLLVFQVPYAIVQIYSLVTMNLAKSTYRQAQEEVVNYFFHGYVYGTFACSFYCYCIVSKRFRKEVFDVLRRLSSIRRRTQVIPIIQTIELRHQRTIQL